MLLLAVFSPQSFGQERVGPTFPSSPFCSFSQPQIHGCISVANGNERCLFTPVVFSREMIISNFFSLFLLCPSSRHLSRIEKSFSTTPFQSCVDELVPSLASVILFLATEPQGNPRRQVTFDAWGPEPCGTLRV